MLSRTMAERQRFDDDARLCNLNPVRWVRACPETMGPSSRRIQIRIHRRAPLLPLARANMRAHAHAEARDIVYVVRPRLHA